MLQAFVSLKKNQPSRNAKDLAAFLDALQTALFSKPYAFLSSINPQVRHYDRDLLANEAANPRCVFFTVCSKAKKYWQATVLLPDENGLGAIFFDFENDNPDNFIGIPRIIETSKRLFDALEPRLIRIGDSEARDKLKSRHGLVLMPGLGRIEWLQVVHPDIYNKFYNASELAAAPAADTQIWENGALFIQVYDNPKDWEDEENVSHANMLPAFLAGIAKVANKEAEKEEIQLLERLRSRAQKADQKGSEIMTQGLLSLPATPQPTRTPIRSSSPKMPIPAEPVAKTKISDAVATPEATPAVDSQDSPEMRSTIMTRLRTDFEVDPSGLMRVGVEGPCTIYRVKTKDGSTFFATYQDLERKVYLLDDHEDFAKFLQANGCSVNEAHRSRIQQLTTTYHKPHVLYLSRVTDLPLKNRGDDRVPEFADQIGIDKISDVNGAKILHMWYLNTHGDDLEELKICQLEDWPVTVESKKHASALESDEDYEPVISIPEPSTLEKPRVSEPQASEPTPKKEEPQITPPTSRRREIEVVNDAAVIQAKSQKSSLAKNAIFAILLLLLAAAAFFALQYFQII